MKIIKKALSIITAAGIIAISCGCSVFGKITGGETLRILSGSENAELSAILDECGKQTGVKVEMTYKGSVDIMQEIKTVPLITTQYGRQAACGYPSAMKNTL